MGRPKCDKCDKPAQVYLPIKNTNPKQYTRLCMKHYEETLPPPTKKRTKKGGG